MGLLNGAKSLSRKACGYIVVELGVTLLLSTTVFQGLDIQGLFLYFDVTPQLFV
jgi:hypothetical protein